MRILTRITASGGMDISSAGTDTITLGNSTVDKIIANAPITASAGITSSLGNFDTLFVNGVQITGSSGAGNLVTSGNITGSGTNENPITLQPNISLTSVTASYFTGSGYYLTNIPNSALQNSSVIINEHSLSLGLSFNVITGSSNLTSSQVGNTFTIGIKNDVTFQSVSASFFGNGSQIDNLTASNISNFTNDVRGQFSAGTNIDITNGVISSTGGGGVSAVSSSGNITGSGTSDNPITLQPNISLTSVTASFSGSGANITNITASNISNFGSDVRSLTTIAGTANQVLVNGGTAAASGSVTLSLPQSIATTSSPTFAAPIATTGYRIGSSGIYGVDIINVSFPVVARGVRLISGSNAGISYTGDYVAVGTAGSTSGILLSSSANIVNSAPLIIFNGNITASNNMQLISNLTVNGITSLNSHVTASNFLVANTSSLVGPTTLSNTLTTVGVATFLNDLSGTRADFTSLYVNGVQITGSGGGGSTAYDIAGIYNGKPLASETIFRFIAVRSYDFSTTSADHYFYSAITSSASKTFDLYRNATLIGSVAFSANNSFGTVTINSASFVAGETFSVLAPSSQDTTLSDLYFTFKADTV